MGALVLLAALLAAGAAVDDLAARVDGQLARRGFGADTLSLIDNLLRHEAPLPPAAPPLTRELLARPLAAADAAAIFRRSVPQALRDFAVEAPTQAARPFADLLAAYIDELAEAQRALRAATGKAVFDEAAIVGQLNEGQLSADRLIEVSHAVDNEEIARANSLFLDATARFVAAARLATDFPAEARRFDSPIGIVSIGTTGADRHGSDAALIIDPGGNDVYERAPVTGGAVSVIIDFGGDDVYGGSDVVVRGLSALFDLSGNDRYELSGPGLGAAIAGCSLLADYSGDDLYRVEYFGEGVAGFGLGALLDLGGNDRYELRAWGQGFGLPGGLGMLWDASGDDRYVARGVPDPFERGAGLSGAQGGAIGFRTMLAGGIGILRDDAGNDSYSAEMFAQGNGYYYGLGLLWDGGGDDHYRAVRYAQGNGVHEAVGVLRDESGNDRYELAFGVGQGMGLDLAVGVLFDASGDDSYRAKVLAQGTATANGIGLLADGGGADRWELTEGEGNWGQAEWLGGLPSVGLLVYQPAAATFVHAGKTLAGPPETRTVHEQEPAGACERDDAFNFRQSLAELRRDYFDAVYALGTRLRCALIAADANQAEALWQDLEQTLADDPQSPLAAWVALALRARPPDEPRLSKVLRLLEANPHCSVRALALAARPRVAAAQAALGSSCFRLQAAALEALEWLGTVPEPGAALPSFLRN
jgi:hypothetical protein